MENGTIGVAFEPGIYRDFTGYINWNGVEGFVKGADFDLNDILWDMTFYDGIWIGGTVSRCDWIYGVWNNGTWLSGHWNKGTWLGGTFEGGNWYGGTWRDGTFDGGCWHGGQWAGGKWVSGERIGMVICNPNGVTSLALKSIK